MNYCKSVYLVFFLVVLGVSVSCTNVRLEQIPENVELFGSAYGGLCLDEEFEGFTVNSFYLVNLNHRFSKGGYTFDSDGDGLPNSLEEKLGFDSFSRRSNGILLDSICYLISGNSMCQNELIQCQINTLDVFGFSNCDYQAISTQGLDYDGDFLADSLEVIMGTLRDQADRIFDADGDGVVNYQEITRGSDPNFSDRTIELENMPNYRVYKNQRENCQGENWGIEIDSLPIIEGQEWLLADEDVDSEFTRQTDENIFMFWLILEPLNKAEGKFKLLGFKKKFSDNDDLVLKIEDFEVVGEW